MRTSSWILPCTLLFIFIKQAQSQNNVAIVDTYLLSQIQKNTQEVFEYRLTSMHTSSISDIQHFYFSQTLNDIEIIGTSSSLHLSSESKIISDSNHFIKNAGDRLSSNSTPVISAKEVIELVADQLGYEITEALSILKSGQGAFEDYIVSSGGFSLTPILAKLKYFPSNNGALELVWEITIEELDHEHWWNIRASARTGKIIEKYDFMVNCGLEHSHEEEVPNFNNAASVVKMPSDFDLSGGVGKACSECYEVIKYPLESPLYGERTVEEMSANLDASPFGWHDIDGIVGPDDTITKGNNVNAIEGGDKYGYQPDGGASLNFSGYLFNQVVTEENQYEQAAVTNLFYWVNILHDLMYFYGFNEAAGNFQEINYGEEGSDGDSVLALAQNDSRDCNASFGTPREGLSPRMKIDLCDDKDGAFDNVVLIHEFAHGISNRLVGGSFVVDCLRNTEQMGEGWSDWYALITTMKPGDSEDLPRGIATYYRGFGTLGGGVREYPYTTDLTLNPLTYDSIKTAGIPHGLGTVWASMLWDMTWGLINRYGFSPNLHNFTGDIETDAGNVMAMAIVTEALKLTRCDPGFVDARNAIITAGYIIYGYEIDCVLWPAFAKRGLGLNARQGNSNNLDDGSESYELPIAEAVFEIDSDKICDLTTILRYETGGFPFGGIYSGPGVTDNGDGVHYTFDPLIAGVGVHTITYSIPANECRDASFAMDTIEILLDTEAPTLSCQNNFSLSLDYGLSEYTIPSLFTTAIDNCPGTLAIRQNPTFGTVVGLGTTSITFYATDASGNESSCTTFINVEVLDFQGENVISMYPNPASEGITIESKKNIESPILVYIFDMNGRIVLSQNFNEFGLSRYISIAHLNSSVYFIKIESEEINMIERLIRY